MKQSHFERLNDIFNTLANTDRVQMKNTMKPNYLCLGDLWRIAEEGLQILEAIEADCPTKNKFTVTRPKRSGLSSGSQP